MYGREWQSRNLESVKHLRGRKNITTSTFDVNVRDAFRVLKI